MVVFSLIHVCILYKKYKCLFKIINFLSDEPITKNFRDESLQSTEEKTFFDDSYFYDLIKQGVSLIVIDPEENNKVIGMRISGCFERLINF